MYAEILLSGFCCPVANILSIELEGRTPVTNSLETLMRGAALNQSHEYFVMRTAEAAGLTVKPCSACVKSCTLQAGLEQPTSNFMLTTEPKGECISHRPAGLECREIKLPWLLSELLFTILHFVGPLEFQQNLKRFASLQNNGTRSHKLFSRTYI